MKREETPINILLADDDLDDRELFTMALDQLPIKTKLTMVNDGEQLMSYLYNSGHHPDILFLDLSMPRKTGFECLPEIKEQEKIKDIPVVVFSTSYQRDIIYEQNLIAQLSGLGAYHYIRKTANFEQFKESICEAIIMVINKNKADKETGLQ
ncbi:MAG: transcriptional regulator [Bacteroidetes bacterium]|nr:transcriptional regulator [Bacteroidota bacterium]